MTGFVRAVRLRALPDEPYLESIPAVRALLEQPLALHPGVTFLVGENGSGKSTLVEAIAVAAKMNPEGGGYVAWRGGFSTRGSHSSLHEHVELELDRPLPPNRFFLRAESVFNLATWAETPSPAVEMENVYERPLHEQSHGESFLDIALHRLGPDGFYVLDEPEAALSVRGQLALVARLHELVGRGAQFVVATHSPILIGYPHATIYRLDESGVEPIAFAEADQVELTRSFLEDPNRFLRHLLDG